MSLAWAFSYNQRCRCVSVKMLKKDKNGTAEWLAKLPDMAKQLEVSLYRNARSFEAYVDMSTLKQRLQQIAAEVSRKARSQGEQRDEPQRDRLQSYTGNIRADSGGSSSFAGGMPNGSQHQQMAAPTRGPVMNLNDMNQLPNNGSSSMNMNGGISAAQASNYTARTMNDNNSILNYRATQPSVPGGVPPNKGGDPDWQNRIRHKQQRLLLLHHSAKCPHEDGRCPVTQHCADMKRLWKHMEGCKDNSCRVPHCFSSRAILSHYRKCKDPACPACGPVRETVRKSQSRPSSGGMRPPSGISSSVNPLHGSSRMMPISAPAPAPTMDANPSNFQPNQTHSYNNSQNQPQAVMPGQNHVSGGTMNMSFPAPSQQPSSGQQSSSGQQQSAIQNSSSKSALGMSASIDLSSVDPGTGSGSQTSSSRRNESEFQKIRHKQQRLLLLRHASRCSYQGKCPVTPHCASMKKLWEHIAHCRDQQCSVPHCVSSRYVLSHYRRCKDPACPACGPVRDTIRKSEEKQKGQGDFDSNTFDGPVSSTSSGLDPATINAPEISDAGHSAKRSKLDHSAPASASESLGALQSIGSSSEAGMSAGQVVSSLHDAEKVVPIAATSQAPQTQGSEDRSLLNGFTVEELTTHLASLNKASRLAPAKLKQKCSEVLKGLQQHQHGWVFNCPVDPVELGLPDYFEIIKKPMDLGTIHKKLDNGAYHAIEDFQKDVHLTFDNAMTYNEPDTVVYDMAKELKAKFHDDFKKLVAQLDEEDKERRQNSRACVLCGYEKRCFEPPVFFCNGINCASKRIRRNSHFYIGGNNQYFWCNQCFTELDENLPIELVDLTIKKTDLTKKKNDEVHEESWVQCDVCERWIHQVCGLFNTRQNKEHHSEYCCPLCLLDKRKKEQATPPPKPPGAVDLPRTKLSDFLENHVSSRIADKRLQMAEEKSKTDVSLSRTK